MPEAEVQATFPLTQTHRRPPIRRSAAPERIEETARSPADQADHLAAQGQAGGGEGGGSWEITPEAMRQLAQASIADQAWIAKAREALARGADGWQQARGVTLDAGDARAPRQD